MKLSQLHLLHLPIAYLSIVKSLLIFCMYAFSHDYKYCYLLHALMYVTVVVAEILGCYIVGVRVGVFMNAYNGELHSRPKLLLESQCGIQQSLVDHDT